MELNRGEYVALLQRAKKVQNACSEITSEEIERDLHRSLPEHPAFQVFTKIHKLIEFF
jgi:predicted short-subunit dehydrogenase-like oxidoreductase (DUF2520 family)